LKAWLLIRRKRLNSGAYRGHPSPPPTFYPSYRKDRKTNYDIFLFVLERIAVSIAVSLVSEWLGIIPKYEKRRNAFLLQLINTGILTIVLTFLIAFEIYLSWLLAFGLILGIFLLSVWMANKILGAPQAGKPAA